MYLTSVVPVVAVVYRSAVNAQSGSMTTAAGIFTGMRFPDKLFQLSQYEIA